MFKVRYFVVAAIFSLVFFQFVFAQDEQIQQLTSDAESIKNQIEAECK